MFKRISIESEAAGETRGVAWVFEDVRTIRNFFSKRRRRLQLGGPGGKLPQKILKFRVSEMPSPGFSAEHFQ